ncbi:MAG TPA: hypothetical protein VEU51_15920 [Candidatus Acidoferrales bacterium]|nr:hypothetical protein [Candidatus Acidoferrales bacterium]
MDLSSIVADLRKERDRLGRAIEALLGIAPAKRGRKAKGAKVGGKRKKRKGLTAAGRKRLSDLMKKRWAERRKKG